jgi:hypothetical protein
VGHVQPVFAVGGFEGGVALEAQRVDDAAADGGVVFDDQDAAGGHGISCSVSLCFVPFQLDGT